MNNLLSYLLQVIVASGMLYAYYHFALRNKRFHRYNRFYLLSAIIISITIPFLNIPVYFTSEEAHSSFVLQTLTTISPAYYSGANFSDTIVVTVAKENWFTWENMIYGFYALIAALVFIRILISLRKIRMIIRKNPVEKLDHIRFVNTNEPGTPFSFFRWLFWDRKIELQSEKGEQVFRHELFHIEQKHSVDVMFTEILTMIFWVNPFFHLMKKELKAIHEFLADQFAISENKKWEYAELLLMQAMNTNIRLTNPFFHNQIKRRIAMITSSSKPGHQYLRKILVLPIAAIVLALFAFTYKEKAEKNVIRSEKSFTVVIDAGHGGNFPGVKSADNNYTEADLTLELSKSIEKFAKDYNITVVMTRKDENSPEGAKTQKEDLQKRIEITNAAKPDAFISIHMNATLNHEIQNDFSGIQGYISDKKLNTEDRILASTILKNLSTIYSTDIEIKQRGKPGIYVLDQNNYPSVLLECGFIDNPNDLAFISNKDNQEKTARAILSALVKYANNSDSKTTIEGLSKIKPTLDSIPSSYNNALIVIDGKIKGKVKEIKQTTVFDTISSDDIEGITVLKGDSALKKYGNQAEDGVIEIVTKENKDKNINDTIPKKISSDDNRIFEKMDIDPQFDGDWRHFLEKNLNANIPSDNKAPDGAYTVIVQFIVDKNGNLSDVKALTKHGYGMEQEAIRVMKLSPNWKPGIQNGHIVKAYKKQPITFVIESDKKNNSRSSSFNNTDQPVFVNKSVTKPDTNKVKEQLLVIDSKVLGRLGDNANKLDMKDIVAITLLNEEQARKKYGEQGKNGAFEMYTLKSDPKDYECKIPTSGVATAKVIFEKTEIPASFPGGHDAWENFIQKNLNASIPSDSGAAAGTYKVWVQFIVDEDGNISSIKPTTSIGFGMEGELVRLISISPKWIPAIQNGRKVSSYVLQPLTFVIEEDDDDANKKDNASFTSDIEQANKIPNENSLYPNPSTNSLNIQLVSRIPGNAQIKIFDLAGKVVSSQKKSLTKGLNTILINTMILNKGTYIIHVSNPDKSERNYKMIKQ